MSEQVNGIQIPSIKTQRQITFQQNPTPAMQGGTSMQGVDAEKLKQSANNSYLANRTRASKDSNPLVTAGIGAGVWYGIAQGMDKFNPMCEGAYNNSILGKIGAWGDKISTKTFIGRKIEGFARWMDKQVTKLSGKSKIVYSLKNHSTRPEWQFARMPGAGLHGFLAADAEQVVEQFLKPIANAEGMNILGVPVGGNKNLFQKLEQYGFGQKDIDNFVNSLKGKSFAEKALALQKKELELLGAKPNVIAGVETKRGMSGLQKLAEHLKIKKLGFKNLKEYEALKGKFLDNPDKVIKMFDHAAKDPKLKVSIWRGQGGIFKKIKNHLFGRTISFSEYRNKYLATLGKGNHTKLGRALPKMLGWFMEGCTNRFAGGKLAVAMQAGIFADMLYHTIKAPKGEKGKTFAERFVNDFSYFIALTAGIIGMHKIGGFKYAGLDEKGREAYRAAREAFNQKVKTGIFKDKKAYNKARKILDKKLGYKNIKNPITKLLNRIGRLINIGNERVLSYKSPKKWNMNFLRKFANGNILGVPLRILIPMAVVSPFIAKWTTTAVHKIFGRPTVSVLDEEQEDAANDPQSTQAAAQAMVNPQNKVQQPANAQDYKSNTNLIKQAANAHPQNFNGTTQGAQTPAAPKNPQDYQSDTNLIKMAANGQKPTSRTYIPSPESKIKPEQAPDGKEKEPVRTYIPSPAGMVQQAPDMTAAEKALADADAAERYVNETLASLKMQ